MQIVLGIETSCDETAAAIVSAQEGGLGAILGHCIPSQIALHASYGGVVPEVAAREHLDQIDWVVRDVFRQADVSVEDLSGIAVTAGPGLIGGVMVGVMFAKGLALAAQKPLYGINHLEGHGLVPRLSDALGFPYLLLLMSGGHTQFLLVRGVGAYVLLGSTLDDALGETFDKSARCLGLPYPGGPAIEALAKTGDPHRFDLPKPLIRRPGCDFSFSGLKTAVALCAQKQGGAEGMDGQTRADLAASFQETVALVLEDRLKHAVALARMHAPDLTALVLAGGVAANRFLFQRLSEIADLPVVAPPLELCTDNGVMIAWAGLERQRLGFPEDGLGFSPRPRWPLAEVSIHA